MEYVTIETERKQIYMVMDDCVTGMYFSLTMAIVVDIYSSGLNMFLSIKLLNHKKIRLCVS